MATSIDLRGNTILVDAVTTTETNTVAGLTATGVVDANAAGIRTKQAVNNVHDTAPTKAELTTSFGDPATLGRGFIGTVDDADGNTNGYLVYTSDADFFFLKFTKAT